MYEYRKMTPEERHDVLSERKARGCPLHAPPHFKGISGVYLITAACYEHKTIFDTPDLLSLLMDKILKGLAQAELDYRAWVFLPNHYHVLVDTPDISYVGEALRKAHSNLATKVNYIHYNPVKHGFVENMSEWPWSSVHVYLDTMGVEKLRKVWKQYPVRDYGKGWDW